MPRRGTHTPFEDCESLATGMNRSERLTKVIECKGLELRHSVSDGCDPQSAQLIHDNAAYICTSESNGACGGPDAGGTDLLFVQLVTLTSYRLLLEVYVALLESGPERGEQREGCRGPLSISVSQQWFGYRTCPSGKERGLCSKKRCYG